MPKPKSQSAPAPAPRPAPRWRVAHLFAHGGALMTNAHQAEISAMPAAARERQIQLGHLVDLQAGRTPPAADASPSETKE